MKDNDFEELLVRIARKLRERENADGCTGCAYAETEEWELPCSKCKRAARDYWRAK